MNVENHELSLIIWREVHILVSEIIIKRTVFYVIFYVFRQETIKTFICFYGIVFHSI